MNYRYCRGWLNDYTKLVNTKHSYFCTVRLLPVCKWAERVASSSVNFIIRCPTLAPQAAMLDRAQLISRCTQVALLLSILARKTSSKLRSSNC